MFNHTYLVQIAYQNKNASGTNYQVIKAKNKRQAAEKTLKNLTNNICVVVSIKRISKKIVEIIIQHNENVEEAPNE